MGGGVRAVKWFYRIIDDEGAGLIGGCIVGLLLGSVLLQIVIRCT